MSTKQLKTTGLLGVATARWFEELAERGIFTTDVSLEIQTWNPWLQQQTGIPASQAIGQPLLQLYPSLSERGFEQYYRDALGGEVRVLSQRLHHHLLPIPRSVSAYGLAEMAQSVRIAPLSVGSVVVGTITVIDDVTERVVSERELRNQIASSERARAAAEDASNMKDEFLATLSHEIRTPLSAVLGWTHILRTQPDPETQAKGLEIIARNAAAQLRLIEDLLDMARIITGKLRLEVGQISVANALHAALDVVRPAAGSKQIAIKTDIATDLPAIDGDADRLQQAIWNLLSNAVKFTPQGGRIDVRLGRVGDAIELSVRDTGLGLSQEFLPHVFDRFRQADSSVSRREEGLGLGLALVRQIAELHGGTVSVDSAGLNQGSIFSLRLPVAVDQCRTATQLAERTMPISLEGVTVVLADDNDDGREMLSTALRQYGARVHAVATANEALRLVEDPRAGIHVLISDIGMPDGDGYDLIRRIRSVEEPHRRCIPAIAVTAYARREDEQLALDAGYHEHVSKPVDPAVLAQRVSRLIRVLPR